MAFFPSGTKQTVRHNIGVRVMRMSVKRSLTAVFG